MCLCVQECNYEAPLQLLLQAMALLDGIDFATTRAIISDSDINFDRFVMSFGIGEYLARATHKLITCLLYTSPSPRDRG